MPFTHESDQNKFVILSNVDQLTSTVIIHDEANAGQLGLHETNDGSNKRAHNSLNPKAVEYKESLTSRRVTSCVLDKNEKKVIFNKSPTLSQCVCNPGILFTLSLMPSQGRTRETFEVSNDVVQFQLMNNFPCLPPPMLSRFMACCFYKFPRVDSAICKMRVMDEARKRMGDDFAELQQILYVLQAKLDTLQVGFVATFVIHPKHTAKLITFTRALAPPCALARRTCQRSSSGRT